MDLVAVLPDAVLLALNEPGGWRTRTLATEGPVGMLLSVPMTIAVKIALDSQESTRPFALMLGGGGLPAGGKG